LRAIRAANVLLRDLLNELSVAVTVDPHGYPSQVKDTEKLNMRTLLTRASLAKLMNSDDLCHRFPTI
jgi:hypothetical protein